MLHSLLISLTLVSSGFLLLLPISPLGVWRDLPGHELPSHRPEALLQRDKGHESQVRGDHRLRRKLW